MKKIIAFILTFAMLLCLAACGGGSSSKNNTGDLRESSADANDSQDEASMPEISQDEASMPEIAIGDYITFGAYEQDNDASNGKEKIEWLVLDVKDGKALLLSRYIIDEKIWEDDQFDDYFTKYTWEKCDLRKWLNNEFLANAFSASEQAEIIKTLVTADMEGYKPDLDPGNDILDKIFLLSKPEAQQYLSSDDERKCAFSYEIETVGGWWLRTHYQQGSDYYYDAALVDKYGGISPYQKNRVAGIRPALWINLDSKFIKKAGAN